MRWLGIVLCCWLGAWTLCRADDSVLLVLGDSLSAGYGIESNRGWVNLLEARLRERGSHVEVVNASVSGETTAGGLARLPDLLERHRPRVVVLELGGNDGLRGVPIVTMEANLAAMLRLCRDANARVVLVQMLLPPNYGPDYTRRFESIYRAAATSESAILAPFILEGIAEHEQMMQQDGIHPTEDAQARMLANLWSSIEKALGAAVAPSDS